MQIDVKMPGAEGVGAGQTATFKLPIGRRFHELKLTYSGVTLAQINEIRVLANAKVIHRYSGAQRDTMNQFDGLAAAGGILTIPFNRHGLKNRQGEEITALNTGSADSNGRAIVSAHVEIDIDAAAIGTVLSLTATQDDALEGGPGTVLHVRPYTYSPAGAGEYEIADLPKGGQVHQSVNRIFMNSANITELEVERGLFTIFDRTKALNDRIQTDGERVPQANWFVWDKSERGYAGEPVSLVGYSDFRLRLEMSGAATVPMLVEYLGGLGD